MSKLDKVVVKSDGETILKEKDFSDMVCLVRRKTGEDVLLITGNPYAAMSLMASASARLADKVNSME